MGRRRAGPLEGSQVSTMVSLGQSAVASASAGPRAGCTSEQRVTRSLLGYGVVAGPFYVVVSVAQEVHGLIALMELQASRLPARSGPSGEPVLLAGQDRRCDRLLIHRGLATLQRAEELGGCSYTVQAAIAACHATASSGEDTDWTRIVALYTVLTYIAPSPVVRLNRAVAVGMAEGAARGLELTDQLRELTDNAGERCLYLQQAHESQHEAEERHRWPTS